MSRRVIGVAGLAGIAVAMSTVAHVDDPKVRDFKPHIEGPSYRANVDATLGEQFPASGVELMSMISITEFEQFGPNHDNGNDCWGYTSPSGREYAIMGLSHGTGFVEITDPGNAQILTVIPGPGSLWRDVKTYQNYAYAVTEANGGIQVMDMSDIDNGNVTLVNTVASGSTHNVAIDETSGYLYRIGGGSNGLRIYDLANPANPVFVGQWQERYVHDAQIVTYDAGTPDERQIAFCCGGLNGGFGDTGLTIVDVTNKANTTTIGQGYYTNPVYSHQSWISEDGQYLYLDDEINENDLGLTSTTQVFDISDLENPVEVGSFTNGRAASTHNLYVHNNMIFAANYRSGLRVFDLTDPVNGVEIAFFDTDSGSDAPGYSSLWSNYPFFESGTVIGSDMQRGLFVWKLSINQLEIVVEDTPEFVDPEGQSLDVEINELDGELDPSTARLVYDAGEGDTAVTLTANGGNSFTANIPALECGTAVSYYFEAETTTGSIVRNPAGAPGNRYNSIAAYGQDIVLEDDFEVNTGWTVENDANLTDGAWTRGDPVGGGDRGDPANDSDGSGACYVTDNVDGNSDVDGGITWLISPTIDLSDGDARIGFDLWYTNNFGADPDNDLFKIYVSNTNGASWVLVDTIGPASTSGWNPMSFNVSDYVAPNNQVRVRFEASDLNSGSVVEAGIDRFKVNRLECEGDGIAGDLDGNGIVDVTDLLGLLSAWGPCEDPCPPACDGDITGAGGEPDCNVDVSDLLMLLSNWG